MALRMATCYSLGKCKCSAFFYLVLMTARFTFTCLQYPSMLGCCLHFILFSVETFLEISDSFLVESILLVCNLFYTPWFWATVGLLLFSLAVAYLCVGRVAVTCTSATFILEYIALHFRLSCVTCRVIAETFSAFDFVMGIQTRNHSLLPLHIK